ncbi:MAG TPA: hypothetical protein VIT45_13575 [Allosphingosinicella sp.]
MAKAPAWIALSVGGILLLWMAGSFAGAICVPPDSEDGNGASSNTANSSTTTTNMSSTNTSRISTGNTAGNTQGTVTNAQGRPGG